MKLRGAGTALASAAPRPAPDRLCPDQDQNIQVGVNILRPGDPNPLETTGDAVTVAPGDRLGLVAACMTRTHADRHRLRLCLTNPADRTRCWTVRRLAGDEWSRRIIVRVRMEGTWEVSARSGTAVTSDTFTVAD